MEERERLAQYSWKYEGDWAKIAKAISSHEPVREEEITDAFLTVQDSDYPESLRKLRYPPWVLFYRGDKSLLRQSAAVIIGSRKMTWYGKASAELSASILAKRFVLVSGLNKGADSIVHRTAIGVGGRTIGVVGCGLNTRYPKENEYLFRKMEEEQLILSEYPSNTGVKRHHFPWRNRILAALGDCVIVTQASLKSGTMSTVNEAITLGKEVWCFPYPCGDETGMGCNQLIFQGANIVYDPKLLEELVPLKAI